MNQRRTNASSNPQQKPAKKPWSKPTVKSSALLDRRALMACSGRPQFSLPICTGIISG
ncbi:MAG: hypothetical protein JW797_15645 [Bradymonadales bacterium]|nr:hypothetical protein [Bradymonadales bacterium]